MKKRNKLSINMILFVLSMVLITWCLWGAENNIPIEELLIKQRSCLRENSLQELIERIKKTGMNIEKPSNNKLILSMTKTPEVLFSNIDWIKKANKLDFGTNIGKYVSLENFNATYKVQVGLVMYCDENTALQRVIESAYKISDSCTRPSAWSCEKYTGDENSCVKIPKASFVASFIPHEGYPDSVNYCFGNMQIVMQSSINQGESSYTERLIEIGKMFNSILADSEGNNIKCTNDIKVNVLKSNSVENIFYIKWSVNENIKDHWIRMDINSGSLSILDKTTVKAKSVSVSGAIINVYAISPDGSKWYKNSIKIESK